MAIQPASVAGCADVNCFARTIGDAMGPGVVGTDGHATGCAALGGKNHTVIAGGTARIDRWHVAIVLAFDWILEHQYTTEFRIRRRRTNRIVGRARSRSKSARTQSKKYGRVALLG